MNQDDLDREYRIDQEFLKLKYAKTPEERREAFARMSAEIRQRSPQRVAQMEAEKGLR